MSICPGIIRQCFCVIVVIVCGNCRFASELHMFTVTCYSIDETLRLYADRITHISSTLEDCLFGFICGCVGCINSYLAHIGNVIFGYYVGLSSTCVMAASMSLSSLFVLVYMYLFSLSFFFFWICLVALILN